MRDATLAVRGLRTVVASGGERVRAVDGIDLEIRPGETFAIVGESGCGKTMTALSLVRLLPEAARITAGEVLLDDTELLGLPEVAMRSVRGRRVSMIFQEPATSLNPVLTVGRQIEEVLERHMGTRGREARNRATELLAAVGIADPARRLDDYPFQLSGGMKQRVMIAIALAADPEVIVADEPTTALDVTIQAQVLDLLREMQARRGMSILLITHDLGVVAQMAHRVAVMYAGELIEVADRDAFFARPMHPYSRKLFAAIPGTGNRGDALAVIPGQVPPLSQVFAGCRFADRCDTVRPRCRESAPGWTGPDAAHVVRCFARESEAVHRAGMVDTSATEVPPETTQESAAGPVVPSTDTTPDAGMPLLEVRDLVVHFPIRAGLLKRTVGHVRAVDGVSLAIHQGETLALVGESGCGKTTVGKAIVRLVPQTSGTVWLDSADLTAMPPAMLRARRAEFQIIFQDPFASLDPRMRVEDILLEGMTSLGVLSDRASRHLRINELLDRVGLPRAARTRYPHEFSGGQRQRIAIARALAVNPRLIVCDEPTSALDVSVQAQILNLFRDLQRELGVAYLFITHNIGVVEYLAQRVAVMYLGRIVEEGPASTVLARPRHPYTQALLSAVPRIGAAPGHAVVRGETPSAIAPPPGCHFHPRCPRAGAPCRERYPEVRTFQDGGRVACFDPIEPLPD